MNPSASTLPLNDIHLPDTISWWPLAPGWWLLLIALLASIIGLYIMYQQHRRYRRYALKELKHCYEQYQAQTIPADATISAMLSIIKRTAIAAYPQYSIAHLCMQSWVDFLNRQTTTAYFSHELQTVIVTEQYQAHTAVDILALHQACKQWIRHHKRTIQEEA